MSIKSKERLTKMNNALQINPVKIMFIFTLITLSLIPQKSNTTPLSKSFTNVISCYEEPDEENKPKVLNLRALGHL